MAKKLKNKTGNVIMERELTMPGGIHVGKRISELPSSYLKYVAENWNEKNDFDRRVIKAADDEYQFRKHHNLLKQEKNK